MIFLRQELQIVEKVASILAGPGISSRRGSRGQLPANGQKLVSEIRIANYPVESGRRLVYSSLAENSLLEFSEKPSLTPTTTFV